MKKIIFLILIFFALPWILIGRDIKEIKKSGKIYAAFTESSLKSVNYKLALEFAKFLNVELVVVPTTWEENFSLNGKIPNNYQTNPNISYTPDALKKADFICGTIYIQEWRKKFFNYAGILDLSDLLIIPKNAQNLKTYDDLKGLTIAFLENSSYESNIESINNRIGGGINFIRTQSEEESVELLKKGKVDGFITVAYNALEIVKNSTKFKFAFPVAPIKKIGWAVEKSNNELEDEINNFFETIKGNGKLDELFISHYGMDYNSYFEILNSYSQSQDISTNQRDLDEILSSGKITVALRDRLMVYSKDKKQFNTYLAEEFAKYIGVKLELKYTPYFSKYFDNENGEFLKDSSYTPEWFNYFDVAAEIMVPLDWRLKKVNIIPFIPYAQVVISRINTNISSINDLKKLKGVTSKGSAQEDILINNNLNNYYYAEGNNFLKDISSGKADYAIGSDAVFSINNYENLEAKFVIGQVGKDGWAIKKNQPKLRRKILEFLDYAKKEGILDKYFKIQTGMSLRATENYLTVLQETYQPGIFPFVSYGTKEGLPQEDILSIYQDRDNYMWFGTHAGAVKYNGRQMRVFDKSKGLASNSVFDIVQDNEGTMFFATLKGASIYEDGEITNIFPDLSFRKIYVDFKNNKWFFGDNGIALYKFDREEKFLNKENLNLPRKVYSISRANDGVTYLASKEGLFLFDNELKVTQISDDACYFVFIDEENQLWISTINGLYVFNLNNLKVEIKLEEKINEQLNLPKNTIIKSIKQTSDGTIWFISDSKIFQLITLMQKPIVYDENIGLKKQRILSFLEDKEENLWIGYSGGIQKLTNKSLRLLFPKTINNYINSITEDKLGRMWISQNSDVFILKDKLENFTQSFSADNKSYVVSKLSSGNIIIASTAGIYEIDIKQLKIIKKNIFSNPLHFLNNIYISSNDEIFLLTGENGIIYYLKNLKSEPFALSNLSTTLLMQLTEFDDMIIGGNNTGLVYFNGSDFDPLVNVGDIVWSVCPDNDILWVGTEGGLGYFKDDEYVEVKVNLPNNVINAIKRIDDTYLWLGTNGGFFYFNKKTNKIELSINSKDGLQGNEIAINGLYLDEKGILWIGTYHGISTFDIKKNKPVKYTPEGKIEKIILNGEEITLDRLLEGLKFNENNLIFEITGLSFKDEKSIEYEFFMKGLENDYSASRGYIYKAQYNNLPPGKYQFNYRTKGNDGIWSYYKQIEFVIAKPIWAEWWFRIIAAILITILIYGFVKWRNRALEKQNEELEKLVKSRTAQIFEKNEELQQQKEEILAQRDEIEKQRDTAEKQRDEITFQKKEITDSILYASRIQNALLPPKEYISNSFSQHFILYLPRDIVSGDYYWMYRKDNKAIIVAADCTGHGVPGAFMSMLGSAFLSEITTKPGIIPPAHEILNELRALVISTLHQTGGENETKDGMDIALCVVDFDNNTLNYSGAFNSLYLIRNNEFFEYKADRMPIGVSFNQDKSFTNHKIDLQKNDTMYIFSDGFIDQFGGTLGKKFKSRQFKNLILSFQDKSMEEQKQILHKELHEWRGKIEQIDDILVVGFKYD
ncbi:MAG: transporter substrate-binding domain-containing protein [Bacteroidales bacterium]|nr:transporter substrate-binding domain-containing protein [Bacteroidales bacterium]MBN2757997.1 transporter substrate-binding domain-containing protein [Bacteroidales bacterium]